MREGLFRIGEVARLFHISVATLRHYESIGLLEPEFIDMETGYRYYSVKQFECLHTICYLKVLDIPLCEIASFLKNRDIDVIQRLLTLQKEKVEDKLRELERVERKIRNRISQLEDAVSSKLEVIGRKTLPAARMAILRSNLKLSSYLDLEISIRELEKDEKNTSVFLGKVGVGISKEKLEERNTGSYDLVFLQLDDEDEYNGSFEMIKETDCVFIRFCGSHSKASPYYIRLLDYIHDNNLEITGSSREITLIDYGLTNDEQRFVTEIQIPIKQTNMYTNVHL